MKKKHKQRYSGYVYGPEEFSKKIIIIIEKHNLNRTSLAAKLGMTKQTFGNKMKSGFTVPEQIKLRDYLIDLGMDCQSVEAVNLDDTMKAILK